jgi:hypothetical protein
MTYLSLLVDPSYTHTHSLTHSHAHADFVCLSDRAAYEKALVTRHVFSSLAHHHEHTALLEKVAQQVDESLILLHAVNSSHAQHRNDVLEVAFAREVTAASALAVGQWVVVRMPKDQSYQLGQIQSLGAPVLLAGQYLELQGPSGDLHVGQIVSVLNDKEISVRYLGDIALPDETLPLSSERIHPVGFGEFVGKRLNKTPAEFVNWRAYLQGQRGQAAYGNLFVSPTNLRGHSLLPVPTDRFSVACLDGSLVCVGHGSVRPVKSFDYYQPVPADVSAVVDAWNFVGNFVEQTICKAISMSKYSETLARAREVSHCLLSCVPCMQTGGDGAVSLLEQHFMSGPSAYVARYLGMSSVDVPACTLSVTHTAAPGVKDGASGAAVKLNGLRMDPELMKQVDVLFTSPVNLTELLNTLGGSAGRPESVIACYTGLAQQVLQVSSLSALESTWYWLQAAVCASAQGKSVAIPDPFENVGAAGRLDSGVRGAFLTCLKLAARLSTQSGLSLSLQRSLCSFLLFQATSVELSLLINETHLLPSIIGWLVGSGSDSSSMAGTELTCRDVTNGSTASASTSTERAAEVLVNRDNVWECPVKGSVWLQLDAPTPFNRVCPNLVKLPERCSLTVLAGPNAQSLVLVAERGGLSGRARLWITLPTLASCVRLVIEGEGNVAVRTVHVLLQHDSLDLSSPVPPTTPPMSSARQAHAALAADVEVLLAHYLPQLLDCLREQVADDLRPLSGPVSQVLLLCLARVCRESCDRRVTLLLLEQFLKGVQECKQLLAVVGAKEATEHVLALLQAESADVTVRVQALSLLRALLQATPAESVSSQVLEAIVFLCVGSARVGLSSKTDGQVTLQIDKAMQAPGPKFAPYVGEALTSLLALVTDLLAGACGGAWKTELEGLMVDAVGLFTTLDTVLCHPVLVLQKAFWVAVTCLSFVPQTLVERLPVRECDQKVLLCENHDDGTTQAAFACEHCGKLCDVCDAVLHRSQTTRAHQRTPCKSLPSQVEVQAQKSTFTSSYLCLVAEKDQPLVINAQFSLTHEVPCESCGEACSYRSLLARFQAHNRVYCCACPRFDAAAARANPTDDSQPEPMAL